MVLRRVREDHRLPFVDQGGRAGKIHDGAAFAIGQASIEWEDRMLLGPEVDQNVAPRRTRRQIDRDQGAGCDAEVPADVG